MQIHFSVAKAVRLQPSICCISLTVYMSGNKNRPERGNSRPYLMGNCPGHYFLQISLCNENF